MKRKYLRSCLIAAIVVCRLSGVFADESWPLHTIDDVSRGADGVRLGDVDNDGRADIVTGWEEGGQIRICFQPVTAEVRKPWTSISVGHVKSPEDAVFTDVNSDGWLDVVSCCEGKEQTVYFHINPGSNGSRVRDSDQWKTVPLKSSVGMTRWMFCEPLGDGTLILGSKEPNAQIVQYRADSENASGFTSLRKCGWIMSLRKFDVDADGDSDVIYSDRKGNSRGVGWLENCHGKEWKDHSIGGQGLEAMFLDVAIMGNRPTVFCNTANGFVLQFVPTADVSKPWKENRIPHPPGVGTGKGVAIGDLDGDGQLDIACTCEHAEKVIGAYWLQSVASTKAPDGEREWLFHDIGGSQKGIKFDRIELLDIDQDGDPDLLTCEERHNLGVIWYENTFGAVR